MLLFGVDFLLLFSFFLFIFFSSSRDEYNEEGPRMSVITNESGLQCLHERTNDRPNEHFPAESAQRLIGGIDVAAGHFHPPKKIHPQSQSQSQFPLRRPLSEEPPPSPPSPTTQKTTLPPPMAPHHEPGQFKPRDTIGLATKGTLILGGTGLFVSAVQNTLTKQNVGPFGVITRTGGTIATFGTSPPLPSTVGAGAGAGSPLLKQKNSGNGRLLHVFP